MSAVVQRQSSLKHTQEIFDTDNQINAVYIGFKSEPRNTKLSF